jgi:hypothetical protein
MEDLIVDIALDSPPGRPLAASIAGPTFAPAELAARKVIALFDRRIALICGVDSNGRLSAWPGCGLPRVSRSFSTGRTVGVAGYRRRRVRPLER